MLQVVWASQARDDLRKIIGYVAARNPVAARGLRRMIEDSVLSTSEHPYLYRIGRVPGTREIVAHPNYLLVYQVTADAVEVLRVLHARQQYP